MSLRLIYPDAFLGNLATIEREDRSFSYVDTLGSFTAAHRQELARLRHYILICMENIADQDDLFDYKMKIYKDEFERALAEARAAQPDPVDGTIPAVFSIPLERA